MYGVFENYTFFYINSFIFVKFKFLNIVCKVLFKLCFIYATGLLIRTIIVITLYYYKLNKK